MHAHAHAQLHTLTHNTHTHTQADSDDEDPMARYGPLPEAGNFTAGPVEDGEEVCCQKCQCSTCQ